MGALDGFLVIAAIAVAGVLLTGLAAFAFAPKVHARHGNKLMRLRVGLQLFAVLVLGLIAAFGGPGG